MRDVNSCSLLSKTEQRTLFEALAAGNETVKKTLIEANLRLVIYYAKPFQDRGLSLDDLIQEGNFGLMEAVDHYDYRMDVRFSTYAKHWIRRAIRAALVNTGYTVRVPIGTYQASRRWKQVHDHLTETLDHEPTDAEIRRELIRAKLAKDLDREPTDDEVAQKLVTLTKGKMCRIHHALATRNIINHDNSSLENDEIPDTSQPPEDVVDQDDYLRVTIPSVHSAMSQLLPEDQGVLQMRFGFNGQKPMSCQEIGKACGLSHETVRKDRLVRAIGNFRQVYAQQEHCEDSIPKPQVRERTKFEDRELIQQLKALTDEFGQIPSQKQIAEASRDGRCVSYTTLRKHFGSYAAALEAAGLASLPQGRPRRESRLPKFQEAELIQQLQALTDEFGQIPLIRQINEASRTGRCASYYYFCEHFGSYAAALKAAKLTVLPSGKRGPSNIFTNEEIIQQLQALADKLGRVPSKRLIDQAYYAGKIVSYEVICQRFHSHVEALKAAGLTPIPANRPAKVS